MIVLWPFAIYPLDARVFPTVLTAKLLGLIRVY